MELKYILEAVLFSSQKPLSSRELRDLLADAAEKSEDPAVKPFKKSKEEDVTAALEQLEREHGQAARSYRLVCVAGSWQFVSQSEYAPWLKALYGERNRPPRLSQPALETLAIIAYRQPVTRAEIEQIRGVSIDGVMQTLLERGLIEPVGRAEVVGRPMTYGTTPLFLEYFGLRSLEELPVADELRRIVVRKPEALLTVEPGLATVPPEPLTAAAALEVSSSAEPAPAPSFASGAPGQKPSAGSSAVSTPATDKTTGTAANT
ncbi:MAG: SMC-Scp complex subunit ScpB [Chloroflexi bacterium]|nr:SMC-Scp complex subunit ScpB [Chloroflexota bacterium]